ncbi:hypothetical protein M3P19_15085 [Muricauda sp. 2012CJ35-5]|uniref:Outer membrane protein beta-barrel domain-containing protein n=1 Tax=Flagellimonas spongiicola TaxID=2942208 RepID=A0ABT0PVD4_9FLAO|nr:hypothetical protein [Allomuricauda spongiicola]MCL6275340.1 hypothetical protein [Allomuricauda spongiicola]
MRSTILVAIAFFTLMFTANAQDRSNFKAGFSAGIPVGDAADISSFSIGFDVNYHWGVSELLDVGVVTGFINAFGDTMPDQTEFEDVQFIPVAGSLRIYPTYHFKFGGDVGYAIGVNDGNEGGLFYRPVVGYNITGNTELNVSYTAVSNDGTFSIATVGILFLF